MQYLIILLAVYAGICIAFYFFQHLLFFRPELLARNFTYQYPFPFEELNFDMPDGGKINAIYFKVPRSRGVVYYLKGNSRSIKGWGKFAKDFLGNGYDFLMMDYRGFGKSRGKRTLQTVFGDAQHLYTWLATQYREDQIIVYGRSLGSGIAARIASNNKPRLLILDSPYYSMAYNIKRYFWMFPVRMLLRYDIRTYDYIKSMSSPVHIIHGKKDHLISFHQSEKLRDIRPELVKLYPVEGAHHNNLPDFESFYEILYDILYIKPRQAS